MTFENWKEAETFFSKKENILSWFGERGIYLYPKKTKGYLHLSKFKWINGFLFYSVKGDHDYEQSIEITEPKHLDVCMTHRSDGSSIITFEVLYSSVGTLKDVPDMLLALKNI